MQKRQLLACFSSFKDSLPAQQVGHAILQCFPPHFVQKNIPLSDGGEGFLASIKLKIANLQMEHLQVVVPHKQFQNTILCEYGVDYASGTAYVEMAKACGIEMIPDAMRNPYMTTTYGVGQVIRHLYEKLNIRKIVLGIGGSSTNDAGLGALQAMGLNMFDEICKANWN